MFMPHPKPFALTVLVGWVIGCTPAEYPGLAETDRDEILATTEQALEIANSSGDWEAYVDVYYAPDAILMPPNHETVRGHAEIVGFFGSFPPLEEMRFNPISVEGAGDIAYVHGSYSLTMRVPGAEETITDRGKYIEVWHRQQDDNWKLALDIFNSDLPLPEG